MTCVFWKEGASKHHWGAWSTEGCRTEQPSPSQVLCRCNHLTYFAVLMVCVHLAWVRLELQRAPYPGQRRKAKAGAGGRKSNSNGLIRKKKKPKHLMGSCSRKGWVRLQACLDLGAQCHQDRTLSQSLNRSCFVLA